VTDRAAIYAESRTRLTALAPTLTPEDLAAPVPACPGWTVKDLYGHLAGLAHDIEQGISPGGSIDEWTAVHVETRRDTPIEDVLAEWQQFAPAVEKLLDAGQAAAPAYDAVTHEQDVLGALGRREARDSAGVAVLLKGGLRILDRRLREEGAPALEIQVGERIEVLGEGEPQATLRAEPFELARALSGRRSATQIKAFGWSGDVGADTYVPLFSFLPMADRDVVE